MNKRNSKEVLVSKFRLSQIPSKATRSVSTSDVASEGSEAAVQPASSVPSMREEKSLEEVFASIQPLPAVFSADVPRTSSQREPSGALSSTSGGIKVPPITTTFRGMFTDLNDAQFRLLEGILATTYPKCPGRPTLRQLSEQTKISQNKLRNWFKWRIDENKKEQPTNTISYTNSDAVSFTSLNPTSFSASYNLNPTLAREQMPPSQYPPAGKFHSQPILHGQSQVTSSALQQAYDLSTAQYLPLSTQPPISTIEQPSPIQPSSFMVSHDEPFYSSRYGRDVGDYAREEYPREEYYRDVGGYDRPQNSMQQSLLPGFRGTPNLDIPFFQSSKRPREQMLWSQQQQDSNVISRRIRDIGKSLQKEGEAYVKSGTEAKRLRITGDIGGKEEEGMYSRHSVWQSEPSLFLKGQQQQPMDISRKGGAAYQQPAGRSGETSRFLQGQRQAQQPLPSLSAEEQPPATSSERKPFSPLKGTSSGSGNNITEFLNFSQYHKSL